MPSIAEQKAWAKKEQEACDLYEETFGEKVAITNGLPDIVTILDPLPVIDIF